MSATVTQVCGYITKCCHEYGATLMILIRVIIYMTVIMTAIMTMTKTMTMTIL